MSPAIQQIRAQIWEASNHDASHITAAKSAVLGSPDDLSYWEAVMRELQGIMQPRKQKKRKPKLDTDHQTRYVQAYRDYQARNFPAWHKDGHTLDPRPCDTGTANGLTRFICDFITWQGFRATRITTEGRSIEKDGKAIRIPTQTRKGSADVSSTIRGKSVVFEIKVGKDRPSPAQIKEQQRERQAGGEYFFTHDAGEFFQQYDSLFVE